MLSHAPTKILFPERTDGGPRDPDPRRRAARLGSHGIEIRRAGLARFDVVRGNDHLGTRRTRTSAELLAHDHLEPRRPARRVREPREAMTSWHIRPNG